MKRMRDHAEEVYWNCIVVTSSLPGWRNQIENELFKLKKAELLPPHGMLLVVDDPQLSSETSLETSGVGSGGATLNALLVVAERLSAIEGYTTINSDILSENLILMIHFGRNSVHYPGGNAFIPIHLETSWVPSSISLPIPPTVFLNAIWMGTILASKSSSGVWITSLDFLVLLPPQLTIPDTTLSEGVLLCSVPIISLMDKTGDHGILKSDNYGIIQSAMYSDVSSICVNEGHLICGTTFLSSSLAEAVLGLYTTSPMDRCTYYGTDNACEPVQISLYFDLLLPLFSSTNKDEYLAGNLGTRYAATAKLKSLNAEDGYRARNCIWSQLQEYKATEHVLHSHSCYYMRTTLPFNSIKSLMTYTKPQHDNSFAQFTSTSDISKNSYKAFLNLKSTRSKRHSIDTTVMINALSREQLRQQLSGDITLLNCILDANLHLRSSGECFFTDFHLTGISSTEIYLGSRMIWQCWPLHANTSNLDKMYDVLTCHGFDDHLIVDKSSIKFTIFNVSWVHFSEILNVNIFDVWPHTDCHTLLNAQLFPYEISMEDQFSYMEYLVLALEDPLKSRSPSDGFTCDTISNFNKSKFNLEKWRKLRKKSLLNVLREVNLRKLFQRRDNGFLKLFEHMVKSTAHLMKGPSFIPFYKYFVAALPDENFTVLKIFHEAMNLPVSHSSRLLANVADFLGCLGGKMGGLRSGPAGNKKWLPALQVLQADFLNGNSMLKNICEEFIKTDRPGDIIRASRHYERASHIMISKQVESAGVQVFPYLTGVDSRIPIQPGIWVEASCAARLDLAGGWSDTPPICYELGGCVLNVAIKVNGKRPIGVKAQIIEPLHIVYIQRDSSSNSDLKFTWESLDHLSDYDNPVSTGALFKACLIYTKFVQLGNDEVSLKEQLRKRYNGGLMLVSWSDLAQGSGLGGSSLLAGCILGALFVVMGYTTVTCDTIIHATLCVEQMLTTGGGWQDQVGGLYAGIKLGVSRPSIPLLVESYVIPISQSFLKYLNQRLFLVYTGKIRLARNLLQTVLRNWYAGERNLTERFKHLGELALEASKKVLAEDGPSLGQCIDNYWVLKKGVASGCEPAKVREIMEYCKPFVYGQSLAGAGGGGYMYGMTKEDVSSEFIDTLSHKFSGTTTSSVEVDTEGLQISVNGGEPLVTAQNCCISRILSVDLLRNLVR